MMKSGRKLALFLPVALFVLGMTSPASAFLDKLFSDEEEKPGKHIEKFEPAKPEIYRALIKRRTAGLALARSNALGILPPSPLTRYVNDLLQKLVKLSPVPDLSIVAVVTPEQGVMAQATPDGIVQVSWETLKGMVHEDELAAILAHELAHLLYQHHAADWITNAQNTAAQGIRLIDQYKGMKGKGSGDSTTGILVSLGTEFTERVIAPNLWSRDQEDEADLLGIDIMVKAGYNAELAIRPLAALEQWQAQQREQAVQDRKMRQATLEQEVEASMNNENIGSALKGLFSAVISGAGEATTEIMKEIGGDDHPSPEMRKNRIIAYIDREYPSTYDVNPRPAPWVNEHHATALILTNYESAWAAYGLLESEPKKAQRLIRKAVSGPTVYDTWPRIVFAILREKGNKPKLAETNLKLALKGKEPAFIVFRKLIERRVLSGKSVDALQLMNDASSRLGNPPHLMPYRIALMIDAKKRTQALALHAQCKLMRAELAATCDRAMSGMKTFVAKDDQPEEDQSAIKRLIIHKTKKPTSKPQQK